MLIVERPAVMIRDQRPPGFTTRSPWAITAATLGLLAAVLAAAFPFLPVRQDTAVLTWPTAAGGTAPVTAPLVGVRPLQLTADVGCAALRDLDARSPLPATVLSTTPPDAPTGAAVGLTVSVADGALTVDGRGSRLAVAPLPGPGVSPCSLLIRSTATRTEVVLGGAVLAGLDGDHRPQVTGVYSQLDGGRDDLGATRVGIEVDNRYDSTATVWKVLAGTGAVLALACSLVAVRRDDRLHGRRPARAGRRRRAPLRDGAVVVVLLAWAAFGSMTPDDGYILTMARAAESSGWVGNYYRWFDVPEAPFGWFYELYALWAKVSTSVLWLRIPALVMALATWWLISRRMLPRLGARVGRDRAAGWAAAGLFLCFWLPFGNGLRPEPVVVVGALLATCAVERALATRRVLPLAGGLVAAGLALGATPTGLLAVAPFLVAVGPLLRLLRRRAAVVGWTAALAPLAAAGVVVLVPVFADQTWATVLEATRVRTDIGPNLPWYGELYRYTLLFAAGPDGSLARRFPVLVLVVCTIAVSALLLRRGRIPGIATGPARRLIGTVAMGFVVLALTPTKWTHHFGAFAALGAGVAAVAAAGTAAVVLRSRRNRLLFTSALLLATAFAFTGPNSWWYVSNWGVPWFDKPPVVGGIPVSSLVLAGAVVLFGLVVVEHLRGTGRRLPRARVLTGASLAVLCGLVVLLDTASLAKGLQKQAGSYSLGGDATSDPAGLYCGLSARIRVETDPAAGALTRAPGPGPVLNGFAQGALPPDGPGSAADVDGDGSADPGVIAPGPAAGPVLSSYRAGPGATGDLRTSWYALPGAAQLAAAPLVVGVAGQVGGDTTVAVELGRSGPDGAVRVLDRLDSSAGSMITAAADPSGTGAGGNGWRDLRFDLRGRPADAGADRVRVIAADRAVSPDGWVAVTPPRVPHLTPLLDLTGDAPGYLDWPVAFPNPCLRPFGITDGVADLPRYRVLADPQQRGVGEDWSSPEAGGPLAWITVAAAQRVVPTYLDGDWSRDWGQLRLIEPYAPGAGRPDAHTGSRFTWGWADPQPTG